jgi:hypothetical protein
MSETPVTDTDTDAPDGRITELEATVEHERERRQAAEAALADALDAVASRRADAERELARAEGVATAGPAARIATLEAIRERVGSVGTDRDRTDREAGDG